MTEAEIEAFVAKTFHELADFLGDDGEAVKDLADGRLAYSSKRMKTLPQEFQDLALTLELQGDDWEPSPSFLSLGRTDDKFPLEDLDRLWSSFSFSPDDDVIGRIAFVGHLRGNYTNWRRGGEVNVEHCVIRAYDAGIESALDAIGAGVPVDDVVNKF